MAKSLSLQHKLDKLFQEDTQIVEFNDLLGLSLSPARFDNSRDLSNHLAEGALLNISVIGSKALSIPSGEYMVWATDAGHTMLVPVATESKNQEVFEAVQDTYEITTPELLQHWNKVEKVLAEAEDYKSQNYESQNEEQDNEEQEEQEEQEGQDNEQEIKTKDTSSPEFKSRVDPADIDRNPMLRAMEQQGHTVTSLATSVGVDPPAISRLLRIPKDRQGDPGGRNPSIGTASRIANELRMDVEALFPDIFGVPDQQLGPRESPGNRGSGMKGAAAGSVRKGRATQKWTQGTQGNE